MTSTGCCQQLIVLESKYIALVKDTCGACTHVIVHFIKKKTESCPVASCIVSHKTPSFDLEKWTNQPGLIIFLRQ